MKLTNVIQQIKNLFHNRSSYELDLSQFDFNSSVLDKIKDNGEPIITPIIPELVNPLMAFYQAISDDIVNNFKQQNRPLSKQQHKSIFDKHICIKNFMNEDKSPILKKLWEDSQFIYNALLPLKRLNLNVTIDLTGGCVRDFVLNHHHEIKDLDIMISIYSDDGYSSIDYNELLTEFSEEELKNIGWNDNDTNKDKKVKLIKLCMERTEDISNIYFFSDAERLAKVVDEKPKSTLKKDDDEDDNYNEYVENISSTQNPDRILGVIKTSGKKTHYPIDLLITDLIKPEFIEEFDFDICKASICINNKFYDKSFPKDYSHLISRFVAPPSFWADVHNKTINYDLTKRSMKQLDNSFGDHLERLIKKYPNHTTRLSYQPYISNSTYEKIWEYANGVLKVRTLDIKLGSKDNIENIKVKKAKL